MNFKAMKLICITLLIIIIITTPTKSQALGNIFTTGKEFLEKGENAGNQIIDEDAMDSVSDFIYNVFLGIAICIAIIWGAFIGIQLMMQGAEGKAEMKEALIPYVIGCTVGFSAFGIWKVIVNALQNSPL